MKEMVSTEKLLASIDEKGAVDFLRRLVSSNSENPPGKEMEIALIIKKELESFGMTAELQRVEDNRYNVIGRLEGDSRETLLFNGHMDTVKIGTLENWTCDPLGGEIHRGRLYGRGSCDMKAGLASMIYALKALAESGIKRRKSILFTGVIDEEVFFKGTQKLIDTDVIRDCVRCYIAEPTDCGLASSLQGAAEFTAVIYGKSAHTGMAEKGTNAIIPMADLAVRLKEEGDRLKKLYLQRGQEVFPTINVGVINGGTDILLVPDRCQMSFDRQVFPEENMESVIEGIKSLFDDVCHFYGVNGHINCNQFFRPWKAVDGNPAVEAVRRAHRNVTGSLPREIIFRGYAEIEMLNRYGIPGALYGPGSIAQAHRPDEFVSIEEMLTAAKTYALIACDFVTENI